MTKRQVKRLLGPPHERTSLDEFLRSRSPWAAFLSAQKSVTFTGGTKKRERIWVYRDVRSGKIIVMSFRWNRVRRVKTYAISD